MATFPPEIIAAAQAAQAATGTLASVTLAQWTVESGWGHEPDTGTNNCFGIKGTQDNGTFCWTHETIGGRSVRCQQWFANYATLADAFTAHGQLLAEEPQYAPARACLPDALAFVAAMGPVYATGPGYVDALDTIIRVHDLVQYDSPAGTGPS